MDINKLSLTKDTITGTEPKQYKQNTEWNQE